MPFRVSPEIDTGKYIRNPEKMIWKILKTHFPFMLLATESDPMWIDDINQTGWLCFLQTGGDDFRAFYNACQRELYALAKAMGFRRTRKNKWIVREVHEKEKNEKDF